MNMGIAMSVTSIQILFITLIGYFIFGESVSLAKVGGMIVLVAGICTILISKGEGSSNPKIAEASESELFQYRLTAVMLAIGCSLNNALRPT